MKSTIISIPESLGASVLGFAIVFVVLIVLMYVIKAIRAATEMAATEAPAASAAPAAAPKAAANMVPAKGSLGDIRLFDVDDKTAAMLMAIVADKTGAPLNTLRFLSIREKK